MDKYKIECYSRAPTHYIHSSCVHHDVTYIRETAWCAFSSLSRQFLSNIIEREKKSTTAKVAKRGSVWFGSGSLLISPLRRLVFVVVVVRCQFETGREQLGKRFYRLTLSLKSTILYTLLCERQKFFDFCLSRCVCCWRFALLTKSAFVFGLKPS